MERYYKLFKPTRRKAYRKTESINNANYGEFIKHDVNSPIRSPPDNETKPALPLMRGGEQEPPALQKKESAFYVENSLIDQQQISIVQLLKS